ncbi:MAG: hypothetical protein ABFS14_12510 [Gemmatimonadota bacterium]
MQKEKRPVAFWVISVFLVLSVVVLLLGQTTALFAYDFAVRLGLQETVAEVTEFGVEMNRAFGAGDTAIYIPLIVVSLVGLVLRKRWALLSTAAVMGISAYWSVTMAFLLLFVRGVPGYQLVPGLEYWIFLGAYMVFGIWGIFYLTLRSDKLIHQGGTAP